MASHSRAHSRWLPLLLLGLFVVTAATSALSKSATYDERTNLGLGKGILIRRLWYQRFAWHHPPLSFYISAIPDGAPGVLGGLADVNRARLAMVLNALVLGALVYRWARELYGPRPAIVALVLTCFSPNLLAHLPLVTPDGTLATTVFAAAYAVWRYARRPTVGRAALGGLAIGLSLLSKFTALLFLPLWAAAAAAAVWRCRWRGVGQAGAAALIALVVLDAGYFFAGVGRPLQPEGLKSRALERTARNPAGACASRLLPKPFLRGLDFQWAHVAGGEWGFLMGEHSRRGWPHYFLVAFLIKTPVGLHLLLLAVVLGMWRVWLRGAKWITPTALCLAAPALLLFAWMSLCNSIDIGFRYVLPMLPFLHVLASRIAVGPWRRPRLAGAVLCAGVVAYAAESAAAFPHYLAFFNAWIGGPSQGYRYLIDSNLDWGQDARHMQRYVADHSDTVVFKPGHRFVHGRIVVSANSLQGTSPEEAETYAWLRPFQPSGTIGYSYLIFDVPLSAVPRNAFGAAGHTYLGRVHRAAGRHGRAAVEFARSIACAPAEPGGYLGLAACHRHLGRTSEARRVLLDGLDCVPKDGPGHDALEGALGDLARRQGGEP